MLQQIKEYLNFNKRERNGIFVLITLILILLSANLLLPLLISTEKADISEFEKEISMFERSKTQYFDSINKNKKKKLIKKSLDHQIKYFKFDPNYLSVKGWKKLGLSKKQIDVIINYRKSGGKFYKKEDLKKIYSISDRMYKLLKPFISIATKEKATIKETKKKVTKLKQRKEHSIIELNSADSINLTTLYGIGPAFSTRIIKYRNLLGGYYSKSQLLEVYGFDNKRLKKISSYISVDKKRISKININTVEFKKLLRHPYFSYELTSKIFNFKNKQGKIKSIENIKNIELVTDSLFQKIKPYLMIRE